LPARVSSRLAILSVCSISASSHSSGARASSRYISSIATRCPWNSASLPSSCATRFCESRTSRASTSTWVAVCFCAVDCSASLTPSFVSRLFGVAAF
jgi:hypothetical protein